MSKMTGRQVIENELKQLGSRLVCDVGGMFVLKNNINQTMYQGRTIEELERQAENAVNFQVN